MNTQSDFFFHMSYISYVSFPLRWGSGIVTPRRCHSNQAEAEKAGTEVSLQHIEPIKGLKEMNTSALIRKMTEPEKKDKDKLARIELM